MPLVVTVNDELWGVGTTPKMLSFQVPLVLLPGAVGEVTMSAYKSLNASKSKNTLGIRWEKRYSHESKHQSG